MFQDKDIESLTKIVAGGKKRKARKSLCININLVTDHWMDVSGEGEFSAWGPLVFRVGTSKCLSSIANCNTSSTVLQTANQLDRSNS